MNIQNTLQLYKKNWIGILLITILSTGVGISVATTRNALTHEATLFLNIATKQGNNASTTFDDIQAADRFTETVQGWFKNPNLIHRIEESTGQPAHLSARKQEKQNLIITLPAINEEQARILASTTIEELRNDINQYNTETQSQYTLALTSVTIQEQENKTLIFAVVGFAFGLILALALAHLWQMLQKKS